MPIIKLPLELFIVIAALTIGISLYINYRIWVHVWLASIVRKGPPQVEDATSSDIATPKPVQEAANMLEELGFQQYAISETYLPVLDITGLTWLFVNSGKDVSAEVIEYQNGAAVQFSTWYNDDSLVETSWPCGENIKTKMFWSRLTREGIAEAYWLHRDQMQQFAAQIIRVPAPTRSIDVFIEREGIYKLKHKPIKYRPPMLRGIGITISITIVLITAFIIVAIYAVPEISVENPKLVYQIAAAIILLSGLAFSYLMKKIQYHAGD